MAQHCPQCGGDLPAGELEGLCPRCVALCQEEFEKRDGPRSEGGVEPMLTGEKPQASSLPAATAEPQRIAPGLAPDQRVFDYDLLEEIGRGGMGVVYRARQLSLNRIVAVKTILSGPVASNEAVRRFRGEAEALARLKHPNIVSIYDVFERDGHHFFSMEYVPGQNLADLARDNPLPPAAAARYAEKVARAIEFAHQNGLLHRDLKPSNILIDEFDEPRVTDFGLAKRLNAEADLSYTGQLVGSPQYFAPEQLSAKKGEISPRTDVYSIGAVLYHLITGRPPFNAASLEEVLLKVIDTEPARPRSLVPRVPRDLETICLKCLRKEPARRYASAREVAEDLGRFQAFEPIQARPVSLAERGWRWCVRRKALAGAWTAVLLLLAAFVLVLSRTKGGFVTAGPPPLPLSVAYAYADRVLDDTNWALKIAGARSATGIQARLILGYTNPPFPVCTNPVREMKYELGSNSTLVAFHLGRSATYDPALCGEIKEINGSVFAHQIDGAGNTRVAPCLEQDGRLYSYARPQAASPADMAEIVYRGMTAHDFLSSRGRESDGGEYPDFSRSGKPIRFGYVVRDTDPKWGHFGWVAVSSFSLSALGPEPSAFPFRDSALEEQDWTVRELADGSPVAWKEIRQRSGGDPGQYLRLNLKLGDRTGLDLIHVCRGALYCPSTQGALDSVDISIDTRMTAESSGQSQNANLCPVVVQNGVVYGGGWRMATYTEQNRGWTPLDFAGLRTNALSRYNGLPQPAQSAWFPDFTTNGASLRFGFATRHVTFHNNPEGHAFSAAIDLDNFAVKVRRSPFPR